MKTCSIEFSNEDELKSFINEKQLKDKENILLQIFTGILEQDFIENLISTIKKYLPNIKIIGSTTAGEIIGSKSCEKSTVLSFSVFDNTKIETRIIKKESSCLNLGVSLLNSFEKEDLDDSKVLISFADGLKINAQEFLDGISSIKRELVVAGGLAADNYKFEKTYVFNENVILKDGVCAALLINKDLKLFANYNFNWQSISKKHKIEKSVGNRVYKIDGKTALDFYKYYLGEQVCEKLPRAGIEFPFIFEKEGIRIARVVFSTHEDGSMTFSGDIPEDIEIHIGYGNIKNILENTVQDINGLNGQDIESLFIYSCSARKELLKKYVDYEITPYSKVINEVSGFYTYGEFFHNNLLNQTLTIIGLSENENKVDLKERFKLDELDINENEYDFYKTQGLSHILSVTTNELETLNQNLEKKVEQEVEKSRQKDAILEANARHVQMGEMMNMIVHQYRQPLSALTIGLSSLEFCSKSDMLDKKMFEDTIKLLYESVDHLNTTIEDFRTFFNPSKSDEIIKPSELINKLYNISKAQFKRLDIKLERTIEFDEVLKLDTGKVLQVLLNLIKNASDQIEIKQIKNPQINILVTKEDNYCVFNVEDNAGGVPLEFIEKIFDKGFSTKKESDGSGIGLDMSKTIAVNHLNGDLLVENTQDGACFSLKVTIS